MNARALLALVVVLTILLVSPSAAVADTKYCPLTLWGQWNGVYYYYCLVCTDGSPPAYNMETADRLHTLATSCTDCPDPIRFKAFKPEFQPRANEMPVHPLSGAKMNGYVGKQGAGAKPGVGENPDAKPNDTFFAPVFRTAPVAYTPEISEILLAVPAQDPAMPTKVKTRYFRVLEFRPDKTKFADLDPAAQAKLDTVRLGQELETDPGNTIPGKIDKNYVFGEPANDYKQHLLTFENDTKTCHVHSYKEMKKP